MIYRKGMLVTGVIKPGGYQEPSGLSIPGHDVPASNLKGSGVRYRIMTMVDPNAAGVGLQTCSDL